MVSSANLMICVALVGEGAVVGVVIGVEGVEERAQHATLTYYRHIQKKTIVVEGTIVCHILTQIHHNYVQIAEGDNSQ